jgi:hypothetical protein
VCQKSTDVSEEQVASIFRVEETKQETSVKQLYMPSAFTLVSFLAYSSNLRMEVTCSSETSVDF